jgi:predicted phosphodiesterase
MKIQLLSDLHLETESFDPEPAPGAELLVLAGDICSRWDGYARFAGWPVPVLVVAGNHEYDGREMADVPSALAAHCARHGLQLLHRQAHTVTAASGLRVRVLGTTRWSDFELFGPAQRARAERAAGYFLRLMGATRGGQPLDAAGVRAEGLACRAWLEAELQRPAPPPAAQPGQPGASGWDRTLVVTHFAPSLRSADPRYGQQPGTASFCNADDDLLPRADLWLHGHLHCRHDYSLPRPGQRPVRVVCQARGLAAKGEPEGLDALRLIEIN